MSDRLLIIVLAALALVAAIGIGWLAIGRRRIRRPAPARTQRAQAAPTAPQTRQQPAVAPMARRAAPPAQAPVPARPKAPAPVSAPAATAPQRPGERPAAAGAEKPRVDPAPPRGAGPRAAAQVPPPPPVEPAPLVRPPTLLEEEPPAAAAVTPPPIARTVPEPAAAKARPAAPPVAPARLPVADEARVALVADDSAVVRVKLKKALEASGWQVAMANDGAQALELLDRQRFDLLITDLEMPRMDGRALIAAVQDRPAIAALPILAITGHDDAADLGAAQLRGVLRKPWGEAELAAALAACGDLQPRSAIGLVLN